MFAGLKPHARCLGWAFLLAWVFCAFYSGSMDGLASTIEQQTGGGPTELLFNVLPVGSAVATLVAAVAAEKRLGAPAERRAIVVGAPIAVGAATPALLIPAPDALPSSLLFVAAAVVTGAGSGLMWLMWGQLYAKLPQDAVESCAPASAVVAAVLSLAVMLAPPAGAIVGVTAFPLISGYLFAKEWPRAAARPADHDAAPAHPAPFAEAVANMKHAGFGILAACLFVSIEGSFWIAENPDALPTAGIFIASAVFMLAVSVSATAGPRRVSLGFAYRWMCPVMVAGFAALIIAGPGAGAYAAALVGIASRFAFCLITQMYFAVYAARGKATAVQAFGMGWVFVHLGDLLGVMVSVPLKNAIAYGAVSTSTAAAVLIVATVAAFMLAMGEGNMFPNWDNPNAKAIPRKAGIDVGRPASEATAESAAAPASARTEQPSQPEEPAADPLEARIAELARDRKLTPRETEVFGLLAHGRSIPYVRDALFISRDTAATHAKHIYAKLDVHSRQELIDLVMARE